LWNGVWLARSKIGKEDSESDQIKFRLSDCEFAYGEFRDEESAALKFEGF